MLLISAFTFLSLICVVIWRVNWKYSSGNGEQGGLSKDSVNSQTSLCTAYKIRLWSLCREAIEQPQDSCGWPEKNFELKEVGWNFELFPHFSIYLWENTFYIQFLLQFHINAIFLWIKAEIPPKMKSCKNILYLFSLIKICYPAVNQSWMFSARCCSYWAVQIHPVITLHLLFCGSFLLK